MRFVLSAGFAILGGLFAAGTSWPQQSPGLAADQPNVPRSTYFTYPQLPGTTQLHVAGGSNAQQNIRKLVDQLRQAEDAKKADLTRQLETEVSNYFDVDMELRTTELKKLEERLTKLRAQLDRRSKAKGEVVHLQVKLLVNEAEGLGFGRSSFDEGKPSSYIPTAQQR
jgi:hypothetical protein